MSNKLTQKREGLKNILVAAGHKNAFTTVPENATAPMVYIAPGLPYLTYDYEDAGFGDRIVLLNVVLVAEPGTNDVAAEELDDAVLDVLDAIEEAEGYQAVEVDLPGQMTINGQVHLAVSIEVHTEIRRSDQ